MRIAIPVTEYQGLDSLVCGHFGSAPAFALVDSETMAVEVLENRTHVHGACSPAKTLGDARLDAVIAGGMGAGAVRNFRSAGIKVYRVHGGSVATALSRFKAAELAEMDDAGSCTGHAGGHTCHTH